MFFKGRNKLNLVLVILHGPLTDRENQTYFFRPPVRLAAPLRTVFLAAVFRLVVFRAAVFRLVVFRAVVLRAGLRAVVFRADALRLLVAFFFFAGAMLTKPLQKILSDDRNLCRPSHVINHIKKHHISPNHTVLLYKLNQTCNWGKELFSGGARLKFDLQNNYFINRQ